jgi:cytochrome c oxidase subunit II
MAADAEAAPQGTEAPGPNHGLRIFLLWLPIALAADLLLWFVYGPHMPPGDMASAANGQQFDIKVMSVMAAPIMAFVLCYAGYALVVWRQRPGDEEDGPAIHGNARIQATWITLSAVIVLALFGFGTYELANSHSAGAGGGEGPSPIWKPPVAASKILQIQVIAQQWKFTYRYPKQYGYFETSQLVVPDNTWVQFNVTSIDVIHSFWAYQLGVKADANPGVNNVAYTKPTQLGTFVVRCAELCGLWHGAMFDYGHVVTLAQFHLWATHTEASLADVTKLLPPFALTYDPTVVKQMSAAMVKAGLTGAPGLFYPPQDPVQP